MLPAFKGQHAASEAAASNQSRFCKVDANKAHLGVGHRAVCDGRDERQQGELDRVLTHQKDLLPARTHGSELIAHNPIRLAARSAGQAYKFKDSIPRPSSRFDRDRTASSAWQ